MVAKISFPKNLVSTLRYHENKCTQGSANCIAAINSLPEVWELNFYQKRRMFELRNELNDRAICKTMHVSLNFHPREKMNEETLKTIAISYMQKIGFEDQPCLVYKHSDAAHPHIHVRP